MEEHLNKTSRRDILPVIYEYLLIILPVSIYISLEAMHKHDWTYFFKSPEWGIAIIFLSFQGVALYLKSLSSTNKKINHNFIGLLFLIVVVVTIAAILNSFISLDYKENNFMKISIRITLLFISSASFFILVLSGKKNELNKKNE
ncbi:hypothetical protein [uncultured Psychroserpens sp.]|uniref:hypothetical protein n=1 Tax=uncultured Psychroserpens sp. TaxID=255436 RepID=UPI00262C7897|nr:hypothetical protein [uncultured Psychroserpens sp.]